MTNSQNELCIRMWSGVRYVPVSGNQRTIKTRPPWLADGVIVVSIPGGAPHMRACGVTSYKGATASNSI